MLCILSQYYVITFSFYFIVFSDLSFPHHQETNPTTSLQHTWHFQSIIKKRMDAGNWKIATTTSCNSSTCRDNNSKYVELSKIQTSPTSITNEITSLIHTNCIHFYNNLLLHKRNVHNLRLRANVIGAPSVAKPRSKLIAVLHIPPSFPFVKKPSIIAIVSQNALLYFSLYFLQIYNRNQFHDST